MPSPEPSLSQPDRDLLLSAAHASIEYGLDHHDRMPVGPDNYPETLREHRAAFVTLTIRGQLRGCIGTLEAYRPLIVDVVDNAHNAAFRDPRFEPLARPENPSVRCAISVLTKPVPMTFADENDLLTQLRPGVDGLIISDGGRRATFLPSVWEQLPKPEEFMKHLKQKAGLAPQYWSGTLEASRYQSESFEDALPD